MRKTARQHFRVGEDKAGLPARLSIHEITTLLVTIGCINNNNFNRIEQLERELNDSKLSNQVKDLFIELLKNERAQVFEKFLPANHPASLLDSKENQPEGANK